MSPRKVDVHGGYVTVKLHCLRRKACRGVIVLNSNSSRAPELSRVDLYVPGHKTWTIDIKLSRKGLAWIDSHHRVKGFVTLAYEGAFYGVDVLPITILA